MSPRFLQACELFQPAEKACWEILLRDTPELQGLPLPLVEEAMDKTLKQLWAVLRATSVEDWLKTQENSSPLPTPEDCALNVLLPYFNTGQHALELIARVLDGTRSEFTGAEGRNDTHDLRTAFNLLIHWQLHGCCERCRRAAYCQLSGKMDLATLPDTRANAGLHGRSAEERPLKPERRRAAVREGCQKSLPQPQRRNERSDTAPGPAGDHASKRRRPALAVR